MRIKGSHVLVTGGTGSIGSEIVGNLSSIDVIHIDTDPNDLSGHVDCESSGENLQDMVERVWRAVKTEMGDL